MPNQNPCSICGHTSWASHYEGPVRVGKFGQASEDSRRVWRCEGCGGARLEGEPIDYESDAYRELVDDGAATSDFHRTHDPEQASKLALVGSAELRGKTVADIGCGAGSFLDLVRGMAARTLAVEPAGAFHAGLRDQGHAVIPYAREAGTEWGGKVDLAFAFSVIEHVEEPRVFLEEIRALLAPGGRLLVSTPNRADWLIDLLPDDYAPFFFRHVHRWYFDADSLAALGRAAGFRAVRPFFEHRFDLSNFLLWLRDRRPSGLARIPVEPILSAAFRESLMATGRSDYLYAWMHT